MTTLCKASVTMNANALCANALCANALCAQSFFAEAHARGDINDEVFIALDAIGDCALHSQCVDVKHAAQGFLLKDFGTLPRTLSFFVEDASLTLTCVREAFARARVSFEDLELFGKVATAMLFYTQSQGACVAEGVYANTGANADADVDAAGGGADAVGGASAGGGADAVGGASAGGGANAAGADFMAQASHAPAPIPAPADAGAGAGADADADAGADAGSELFTAASSG
jgi:hypothetical protein